VAPKPLMPGASRDSAISVWWIMGLPCTGISANASATACRHTRIVSSNTSLSIEPARECAMTIDHPKTGSASGPRWSKHGRAARMSAASRDAIDASEAEAGAEAEAAGATSPLSWS